MNRAIRRNGSRTLPGKRAGRRGPSVALDGTVLEAVDAFVRVLARCGCAPHDIAAAAAQACARLPHALLARARRARQEMTDASHILTVWFSDPLYLDPSGAPLRLPVSGAGPSVEALVGRVDRSLDVQDVLRYLLRTQSVRRFGSLYAPRRRDLSVRGMGGPHDFLSLRGLVHMLRTLEYNSSVTGSARCRFNYVAENPRVPARARAAVAAYVNRLGLEFMHAADAQMHRYELERRPGERTLRMGVGVFRFEDDGPPDVLAGSLRKAQRAGQKKRRSR